MLRHALLYPLKIYLLKKFSHYPYYSLFCVTWKIIHKNYEGSYEIENIL